MRTIPSEKVDELRVWMDRYGIEVKLKKDGYDVWWHWCAAMFVKAMFLVFRILSFGRFSKDFDRDFTTFLGGTMYLNNGWEGEVDLSNWRLYRLIRHEMIHAMQEEDLGFLVYAARYLVFPLPVVWTGRSDLEMEAYTQQLLVDLEVFGRVNQGTIDWIVDQFTSPNYAFMEPFPGRVRRKLEEIRDDIEEGTITGFWPYHPEVFTEAD